MKYLACLVLIIALYLPNSARAETVLRMGNNIEVAADQVVDGDYYVSVGPLGNTTMSGKINGDMYAFGGSVDANGTIGKDLTIVAGTVQINASTTDDVRIAAGEVTIAEHVGGDLFVIAGSLKVLSSASVDGDIIFFGGDAEINGKVGGSVLGSAEKMRVDASVGKNIDVKTTSSLTIGDKANVSGFVHYTSIDPLVRAQNANIAGEVTHNQSTPKTSDNKSEAKDKLIPLFITLFATLSLYLLFKKELVALTVAIQTSTLKSAFIGIALIVLGPIISILLMATVLGIFIGVIALAVVVLAYVLGYVVSGIVLGSYLSKLLVKKSSVSLVWILLGTFCIQLFWFIPVIGPLLLLCVFCITVGGLALGVYKLFS